MKTGLINQRIEIYSIASTDDGHGGSIPEREVYWETNAEVDQKSVRRQDEGSNIHFDPIWKFKIRYRNDKNVVKDMLIKWRDSWFVVDTYFPDVVYQEYMIVSAMDFDVGNLVAGSVVNFSVRWGYSLTPINPLAPVFQFSKELVRGETNLLLDFTDVIKSSTYYLVVDYPISQQNKEVWINDIIFNHGTISDSVFYPQYRNDGRKLLYTRHTFVATDDKTELEFLIT